MLINTHFTPKKNSLFLMLFFEYTTYICQYYWTRKGRKKSAHLLIIIFLLQRAYSLFHRHYLFCNRKVCVCVCVCVSLLLSIKSLYSFICVYVCVFVSVFIIVLVKANEFRFDKKSSTSVFFSPCIYDFPFVLTFFLNYYRTLSVQWIFHLFFCFFWSLIQSA